MCAPKIKMADPLMEFSLPSKNICKIVKLKVKEKGSISKGSVIATYVLRGNGKDEFHDEEVLKFKSEYFGTVEELLVKEGDVVQPGYEIISIIPINIFQHYFLQFPASVPFKDCFND